MAKLSVDKTLSKAKTLAKRGEIAAARDLYTQILQSFPKNKRAQDGLASLKSGPNATSITPALDQKIRHYISLLSAGQNAAIVAQIPSLLKQHSKIAVLWNIYGVALRASGELTKAQHALAKAAQLSPSDPDIYNNLGLTLHDLERQREALSAYETSLKHRPQDAEVLNNYANTLKSIGRFEQAIEFFEKSLALKPSYAKAHFNLGNAYKEMGQLDEAVDAYQAALALDPKFVESINNLGTVYKTQGKVDNAVEAYNAALKANPVFASAHNNLGNVLKDQGKIDDAKEAYHKALAIDPHHAEAHRNLSSLIKYKEGDAQIKTVADLLETPNLPTSERCSLHFTYAKMQEDLGQTKDAFDHYVKGGQLRMSLLGYDITQDKQLFEAIKATAPSIKENAPTLYKARATHSPIFILGMPRSGTTLVEQIISCHSQVHGAGELTLLARHGHALRNGQEAATAPAILQLRNAYLEDLEKLSQGKPFVTDKMPQNFLFIALILTALPEAKIIHTRRDPAATCWSNFKHYFSANGIGYSYGLSETAEYYNLYKNLMMFWEDMFPDRIYRLDYDSLTQDQEKETRNLIAHLGLDWEEACLHPQRNTRSVATASQQQVRQKVYQGSSQSWKKFEAYLGDVFEGL